MATVLIYTVIAGLAGVLDNSEDDVPNKMLLILESGHLCFWPGNSKCLNSSSHEDGLNITKGNTLFSAEP
jgi:hypothetical protein